MRKIAGRMFDPWKDYARKSDDSPTGCVFSCLASLFFLLGSVFVVMGVVELEPAGIAVGSILLVIGGGLVGLGHRFATQYHRSAQNTRDEEAQEIFEQIREMGQSEKTYFLYLRPFETTGRLNVRGTAGTGPLVEAEGLPATVEFESLLRKSLEDWGPLVGPGRPGEHLGAGRLLVEDSKWQKEVRRLVRHADTVFIVPGRTLGTLWELRYLFKKKSYLRRAVVVMPPESLDFDFRSLWLEAQSTLKRSGVNLPEYSATGAFILLAGDGTPERVLKMPEYLNESSLRDMLEQLIS